MTAPLRVEVTRPRRTFPEKAATLIGTWGEYFSCAFALMLLVPLVHASWHPGYWQVFAALVVYRLARVPFFGQINFWTREAPKPKKVRL